MKKGNYLLTVPCMYLSHGRALYLTSSCIHVTQQLVLVLCCYPVCYIPGFIVL